MSPPLILQPFANAGDLVTVPQTDPNGFVNFAQGYTPFYEISLSSGNPQAKPVERQVQNAMFNLLTANTQAWQQMDSPPWFSAMPGGYAINAVVVRQNGGGTWTPYRSLVAGNLTDPLTSPASWEYVPFGHEMLANIPMPSGGPNGSSGLVVTTATNFNTIGTGTYDFQTDAVAAASANSPAPVGGSTTAGMLEVMQWSNGSGTNYTLQRYQDRTGISYYRAASGGAWGTWAQYASIGNLQTNAFIFAVDSGAANALQVNPTPVISTLNVGMTVITKVAATNTGATNLAVNGTGAIAVRGLGGAALQGNELPAGSIAEFYYNGTNWILTWCSDGGFQVANATNSQHAIPLSQAQSLRGNFNGIVSYNSVSNTLAAANAGAFVDFWGTSAGTITLPSAATMPKAGAFWFANSGTAAVTITRAGSDTIVNAGGTTSITLQPGDTLYLSVDNGTLQWFVFGGTAASQFFPLAVGAATGSTHAVQLQQAQAMQGNYNGVYALNTSQTLTLAMWGGAVDWFGPSGGTLTLPSGGSVGTGKALKVYNYGAGTLNITVLGGSDFLYAGSSITTLVMQKGDDLELIARGTNEFDIVGGSALRQFWPLVVGTATSALHALEAGQIGAIGTRGSLPINTTGKMFGQLGANELPNSSGELGNVLWNSYSFGANAGGSLDGPLWANGAALSAVTADESLMFTCNANTAYTLTGECSTNGVTAGIAAIDVGFYTSARVLIGYQGRISFTSGTGYQTLSQSGTAPSNAAYMSVRKYIDGSTVTASAFGINFRRLKVEAGTVATNYSQEASIPYLTKQAGVVGTARNISASSTSVSSSQTWTVSEIVTKTGLGGLSFIQSGLNLSFNGATTGAGGMDTGSLPASGFAAIYVISGPNVATTTYGTNATAARAPETYSGSTGLPAGYIASTLLSILPTNASGQFINFVQVDRAIYVNRNAMINTPTASASPISLNVAAYVPLNAREIFGDISASSTGSTLNMSVGPTGAGSTSSPGMIFPTYYQVGQTYYKIPIVTAQTIFYYFSQVSGSFSGQVNLAGYTF